MGKHKTIKQIRKQTERKKELDDYFHNNKHKFLEPDGELDEIEISIDEWNELHKKFDDFEKSRLNYLKQKIY